VTANFPPPRVDVHQHLWTAPLLDALAARERLPFVRRTGGVTILHCAGEQPYAIDVCAEAPAQRASLVRSDRLDLAVIALSSPIGIEALPRRDGLDLIEAYFVGLDELSEEFAAWGPVALDRPEPADVDDVLARGCAGVSLPAGSLAGPDALDEVEPLIARTEALGAPLFVHPGPGRARAEREASLTEPLWWAAMTDYVAQMQAAWLTFATLGRRRHPQLRIVFAMLAGGAPLLSERLAARGGPLIALRDALTFYESSSYGHAAIQAMADRVGAGQLVYGSDRPVAEPVRTGWETVLQANAGRLVTIAVAGAETVAA
jgi:6-methylsalicylate decarboxylase